MLTKIRMLYYKVLLDKFIVKLADMFQDSFKNDNGSYVLAEKLTTAKAKQILRAVVQEELRSKAMPWSLQHPDYYVIIGSCLPKDNVLLSRKNKSYFPAKLDKIISAKPRLKYLMKEADIKLDLDQLNAAAEDVFEEMFSSISKVRHLLGAKYKNVFFLKHKRLDCYLLFKALKYIYGKSNCWNVHKEKYWNAQSPLAAVNDLIDRYVKDKTFLNTSREYRRCIEEVKQQMELLIEASHNEKAKI